MKLSGCGRLSLSPLTGQWFRALNLRHWNTRLSTDHSKVYSSRFSDASPAVPSYRMLYLGENHQVAIFEVGALLGDPNDPVSNPRGSWALMSIQIKLHHIADLSDSHQQKIISTNHQELTGSWINSPKPVPTHELGAALHAVAGLEGFLFPSAKSNGRNLAIFMDKLTKRSSVLFFNELTSNSESLV
jgi:RES domain